MYLNFEQNNESMALNVLFLSKDKLYSDLCKITILHKSEYNLERETKVLFLMMMIIKNIIILW